MTDDTPDEMQEGDEVPTGEEGTEPPASGEGHKSTPISARSGDDPADRIRAVLAASTSFPGLDKMMRTGRILDSLFAPTVIGGDWAKDMSSQWKDLVSQDWFNSAEIQRALARHMGEFPALTRAQDYEKPEPKSSAYSPEMKSPQNYFESTEEVISSFDDLHNAITALITKTPDLPLLWRGAKNAQWGFHSHLFRHLMKVNKVIDPARSPKKAQSYPDEDQMVAAEREILRIAREDWRFDDMSALETFARIQHAGGPTRLIDVTKNPYIGAWFAVEFDKGEEDKDARLFALSTIPVAGDEKPPAPNSTIRMDELGAAREPFWHAMLTPMDRQQFDWGTGARRRVWVPPAYDPRISAQNAAFILDGVPIISRRTSSYFPNQSTYWRRSDLLASASIYAKMLKPNRRPQYTSRNFAPTFSFRIEASAKKQIRDVMESRFGYRLSYIYPDMAALASHLKSLDLKE
jgi:hypothetical protein